MAPKNPFNVLSSVYFAYLANCLFCCINYESSVIKKKGCNDCGGTGSTSKCPPVSVTEHKPPPAASLCSVAFKNINATVLIICDELTIKHRIKPEFISQILQKSCYSFMPAPPSLPLPHRGFSRPHLFCKLIHGHQQPGRLIKQSVGSRESLSQQGRCMLCPLFSSPTEVYVNLLLLAFLCENYRCLSMNVSPCLSAGLTFAASSFGGGTPSPCIFTL